MSVFSLEVFQNLHVCVFLAIICLHIFRKYCIANNCSFNSSVYVYISAATNKLYYKSSIGCTSCLLFILYQPLNVSKDGQYFRYMYFVHVYKIFYILYFKVFGKKI